MHTLVFRTEKVVVGLVRCEVRINYLLVCRLLSCLTRDVLTRAHPLMLHTANVVERVQIELI